MRTLVFSFVVFFLCAFLGPVGFAASVPTHRVSTPRAHHARRSKVKHVRRRVPIFSPIRGTWESLVHQNQMVETDNLSRIQDDNELEQLTESQELLALPGSRQITVAPNLPENRRFCRPWTKNFLNVFAAAHWTRFHRPLQVNSAVRTVEFQEQLRGYNGNAAPSEGDVASPHLTGATVDIAKRGMSRAELKWARAYLFNLQRQGKLDAEEEFQQRVFHISVYKAFVPKPVARRKRIPRAVSPGI